MLAAVFCALLMGCGRGLTAADAAFADPVLDNLLAGMAERNYAKYSADFSAAMKKAITEDGLPAMAAGLEEKLGVYKGRTFVRAGRTRAAVGEIITITYRAEYTKDAAATIVIYISDREGVKTVEGYSITPSGGAK